MTGKRLLVIEPYFGGSHRQFIMNLQANISADVTLLTLPARKWKMRMQLSAPWFARKIDNLPHLHFDTVLCSTFVDVPLLKALITNIKGWNRDCRFCTYYHENQFVYPNRLAANYYQFAAINFHTAHVCDAIAFNSQYNFDTFFQGCKSYVEKAVDMHLDGLVETLQQKARVIYPGIFPQQSGIQKVLNKFPVICWNHRWEHDKNPNEFFETLFHLKKEGRKFKIIVMGQSFKDSPDIFKKAKVKLKDEILHFGYVQSRREYEKLLLQSNFIVSTALHEFFGIAVLEAVAAGCTPVLPSRLSYKELYPSEFLYSDGQLLEVVRRHIDEFPGNIQKNRKIDIEKFSWERLKQTYKEWLFPERCS